jgi:hypothetical protein
LGIAIKHCRAERRMRQLHAQNTCHTLS